MSPSTISGRRLGEMLLAGYPLVLAQPAFRALFLMLLLGGAASGMSSSYVSVWASETFDAGPQAVALLFVVTGLTGAIGNPLLGLISDRFGGRRKIIIGQLAVMAVAYLGYTRVTSYAVALGLVAFSGFGIMGLALAMVHDAVDATPDLERGKAARIIAAERTAWSMGIILGPAIAAVIVTVTSGTRPVFIAAALTQIIAIGVAFTVRVKATPHPRTAGGSRGVESTTPSAARRKLPMATLFVALVLIALPTQTRTMYLPLFVTTVLGMPPGMVGPLFTAVAVTATATMPYVGAAADRFGAHRALYLAAIGGALYCALQAVSTVYLQTLANQVLVGFAVALWSTAGLIYLQQLMPGRAGSAGGLYFATQQVAPSVAGLLLGPAAQTLGIPAAFAANAALCLVALGLLFWAHRSLAAASPAQGEPLRSPSSD